MATKRIKGINKKLVKKKAGPAEQKVVNRQIRSKSAKSTATVTSSTTSDKLKNAPIRRNVGPFDIVPEDKWSKSRPSATVSKETLAKNTKRELGDVLRARKKDAANKAAAKTAKTTARKVAMKTAGKAVAKAIPVVGAAVAGFDVAKSVKKIDDKMRKNTKVTPPKKRKKK